MSEPRNCPLHAHEICPQLAEAQKESETLHFLNKLLEDHFKKPLLIHDSQDLINTFEAQRKLEDALKGIECLRKKQVCIDSHTWRELGKMEFPRFVLDTLQKILEEKVNP
jgi:hypothetical protein